MRWPFSLLFRGDRDAPAAADAGAADPGAPDTAVDPARAAAVPSRPAAWRSLPPVQRSIGDAPLTAPAVAFGRELAGLRPPDPILRRLVHDLAADGPAGLVSGIATPLAGRVAPAVAPTDHAALPAPRGVQRRERMVSAAPLSSHQVEGSAADARPASIAGSSRSADTSRPAGASAADLSAFSPSRLLPVVAPSATAPALGATRVGASTAPEAARALAPTSGALAPTASAVASTAAGSPVQRRASPTPPTEASLVALPTGPDAVPDAARPTPGWGAHAPRSAQPRSLGESRRLGLGAPLAGRPSLERAVAGPDLPLARAGRTTAPPTSPIAALPPPRRAAAAEAALPVLRIASQDGRPAMPPEPGARSGDGAAGTPPAALADADADGGIAGPSTPAVQRSGERPLVGDVSRHTPTPSSDGPDGEPAGAGPAGAEPGEGLPLAIGTWIDGARLAPGGAPAADPSAGPRPDAASTAAAAATGPLSAGHGGAAPPSQPTAASAAPAASTAPAARSVPLVVARSLRGADPLRPGAGAPTAAPPARAGRSAAPAGFEPGSGHAGGPGHAAGTASTAGTFPALQAPGTPGPGRGAPGWAVAQRSTVEDAGSRPTSGAPAWRPSLPVARAAATPGPSGPAAGRSSEGVAVSRLADGGGSAPPPPPGVRGWSAGGGFSALSASDAVVVQRAVEIEELATQVDAAPAPGAAEGATGGAGAGGAGQDYEEIADRVYDRIRSQLATELLLDRERMGLLIDG